MLMPLIASNFWILMSSNKMSMWFFIEINSLIFIMWMMWKNMKKMLTPQLIYLLVSFISSSMFIFFMISFNKMFIMMFIMMKMGIPPFSSWMLLMAKMMDFDSIFILLTIQKMPTIYVALNFLDSSLVIMLLFIWTTLLIKMIFSFSNIKTIIMISSINMSILILVAMSLSTNIFMVMFFIYSINLALFSKQMKKNNKFMKKTSINSMILLFNFSGMPPLPLFLVKLMFLKILLFQENMLFVSMIFIILMVLMMYLYLQNIIYFLMSKSIMMDLDISTLFLMTSSMLIM